MHRYVLAYLELLFSKDCTCSCCSFPDSLFQHFTHISHLLIQLMCIMLQHNSICCTPSFAQLLFFISMYTINLILHYFNYQFKVNYEKKENSLLTTSGVLHFFSWLQVAIWYHLSLAWRTDFGMSCKSGPMVTNFLRFNITYKFPYFILLLEGYH